MSPLGTLWSGPSLVRALLIAELVAVILALAPGVDGDRWMVLLIASMATSWVTLLTLGALHLFRHELGRLHPLHTAYATLIFLTLSTWLVGGASVILSPDLRLLASGNWLPFMLRLSGIALAVGVLGLIVFHNHWRASQSALRTKQAELEALQARTHPHFLFNSLNTAIALLHSRPEQAERVLLDLSDLFRTALAGPHEITLADEIVLATRYLEIERLRLGRRLEVHWELPSPLPAVDVPALSIQPLVENAVRHGIERRIEGGRIDVMVTADGQHAYVTVRNDLPTQLPDGRGKGYGIGQASVAGRIQAMTGGRGSLETSAANGRYAATLRIPLQALGADQVTTS